MAEASDLPRELAREWERLLDAAPVGPGPLALPPERRMALTPVALFAQLEEVLEEWRTLDALIEREHLGRYVNAAWTLKDLLAHLASWAREFRHEVETIARGESLDYAIPFALSVVGPTEWNEAEVSSRREREVDDILREFAEETQTLQNLLLEMPEGSLYAPETFPAAPSGDPAARWKGPSAVVIAGKCHHDLYHIGQIRGRLAAWKR